jgi:periplasmic divalent cation tolerance protein
MRAMGEPAPDARVVLVTAPSLDVARQLAHAWIEAKLVACVNILPSITSVYRWEGKVQEDSEVLLLAKTTADRIAGLEASLPGLHPYAVPEFVVLEAQHVAPRYAAWLADETR